MNQPDGNDSPRKDSNNGPGLWEWVVCVLLVVGVVVWLIVLIGPQIATVTPTISNDL
jgi:hypothetical protein